MKIFTLEEILKNPWNNIRRTQISPSRTPPKWLVSEELTLHDIKRWEEIFYKEGLIGVYAAWEPYYDFYIIVHNFHLDEKYVECYKGPNSVDEVVSRCKMLGIEIPVREIFVD